jgi:hypothetical protein
MKTSFELGAFFEKCKGLGCNNIVNNLYQPLCNTCLDSLKKAKERKLMELRIKQNEPNKD